MKFKCRYDRERFYLRDSYWEFQTVRDGLLTAKVYDVNILSGQDQGEVIESAVVTFQGVRLSWIERIENDKQIRLTIEEGAELLYREPYFVFSYWTDDHECELAGTEQEVFAMLFSYDSAEIGWDDFKQPPVGTLVGNK